MPATRRVEFCFASKSLLYICLFEDKGTNNHKMQKVAPLCARRRCDRIPGRNRVGRMSRSASWFQKLQFGCGGKGRAGQLSPWQQEDELEQSCSHSSSPRNGECWRELEVGANVQRPPTPIYFCHLPQSPIASPNSTTS